MGDVEFIEMRTELEKGIKRGRILFIIGVAIGALLGSIAGNLIIRYVLGW